MKWRKEQPPQGDCEKVIKLQKSSPIFEIECTHIGNKAIVSFISETGEVLSKKFFADKCGDYFKIKDEIKFDKAEKLALKIFKSRRKFDNL